MAPRRFTTHSTRQKIRSIKRSRALTSSDIEKQKVLIEERAKIIERLGDVLFADAKIFEKVPRSSPWIEHVASKIIAHSKRLPSSWLSPGTKDNEILQTSLDIASIAMESNFEISVQDIAAKLTRSPYAVNEIEVAKKSCLQAVFASIGILTMAYDPDLPGADDPTFFNIASLQTTARACPMNKSTQHVPLFLQGFGDFIPRWSKDSDADAEIVKSELDCFTLNRIAKIEIKWTDLMTMHLHYDEASNGLFLFRYPVFCLLSLQREDQISFSGNLFRTKLNKVDKHARPSNRSQVLMREILLSYSLLFGHDSRSSRLYRSRLKPELLGESHCDPWLDHICSSEEWKLPMHNPLSLQSKGIYNTSSDFTLLGSRLVRLKKYCDAQQSRKLGDFWHDRRNPFNFYTFWVVIVFEVLSLLFSILQCALGAAQLRYAVIQGHQ